MQSDTTTSAKWTWFPTKQFYAGINGEKNRKYEREEQLKKVKSIWAEGSVSILKIVSFF